MVTKIHSILSNFSSFTYPHGTITGKEQIVNRQLRVVPGPNFEIFEARMICKTVYLAFLLQQSVHFLLISCANHQ